MRVLKFGGTSVAHPARVASLVAEAAGRDETVVVVSALAGVTDQLVDAIARAVRGEDVGSLVAVALLRRHLDELEARATGSSGEGDELRRHALALADRLAVVAARRGCPPALRDAILAAGERLAAPLVAAAVRAAGAEARVVDAGEVLVTDSCFGAAAVDFAATCERAERLAALARRGIVPVVTGFIGADARGRTTTLGRGGSDHSAAVLGACLEATAVEIWTDVDGVLSAPPALVPGALTVPYLTYEEAEELAWLGGKVLHPLTVRPLKERRIELMVRNTFHRDRPGTRVGVGIGSAGEVRCVTGLGSVVVRRPVGPAHAGGGVRWSFAGAQREAGGEVAAVVAAVGRGVGEGAAVALRMLSALTDEGIDVRAAAIGASPHSVAAVVAEHSLARAVAVVHTALIDTAAGPSERLAAAGGL